MKSVRWCKEETSFFQKLPPKMIIKKVSGRMIAGVNAIMGPSGSGKTSLLDILADRKGGGGITGDIIVNGEPRPNNFRYASGYVPQDDTVTGTLSVRENIMFSASLQLPSDTTKEDKAEVVDGVVKDLGLSHVADTWIGTSFTRGVSGGQRKRTAIAMELIVSPGVLFLDEPTSGLDSTTAISVIKILHDLSRHGRVVIMSIHQPRYSILKLFDTITLLSRGEMIYQGASRAALPYFSSVLDLACEKHNNPADFYLDKIIKSEEIVKDAQSAVTDEAKAIAQPDEDGIVNPYAKKYKASEEYAVLKRDLDEILTKAKDIAVTTPPTYAINYAWQFWYVLVRTFKNIIREPSGAITSFVAIIVLALFTGCIFFDLDTTLQGSRDRAGVLFFSMLNNILPALAGLDLFISERPLFLHENRSGYYAVGSYYVAKVLLDLIPLRIFPATVFCAIVYYMIGLRDGAGHFFFFMLAMLTVTAAGSAQVYSIGSFFRNYSVANTLALLLLTVEIVFAGFFITLGSLQAWLAWLQYLCIYRFGLHALMWNEFESTVFCDTGNGTSIFNNGTCPGVFIPPSCDMDLFQCGDALLDRYEFSANTSHEVGWNFLAMGIFTIAFLITGFAGLMASTRK
ncbi:broad substrate specificity ATP-binding cassette transporter ABCG2-like isoform X1 [Dysidea avara]|uniref:broad substrate specificity ATP-binding cassette transporter ABCG2-like isoform X1 n=1 Tax=Dysidea avara TaxID=196820 RepID=UPI00332864AE